MSETQHHFGFGVGLLAGSIFLSIFIAGAMLAAGIEYEASLLSGFLAFVLALIIGSAAYGSMKADERYHIHHRIYSGIHDRIRRRRRKR